MGARENQLDQGTIIYGIRSDKYENLHCYGIIITASCDIAQQKVSKLYYLLAIDAREWFCSKFAYFQVYYSKIEGIREKFFSNAEKYNLDPKSLLCFSKDEVKQIIDEEISRKEQRSKLLTLYNDLLLYSASDISENQIKEAIKSDASPVVKFLSRVSKGEVLHYYYLPEASYHKNEVRHNGLIVDLQEIGYVSLSDALKIQTDGIDYLALPEDPLLKKQFKHDFWLETEKDFVAIEGKIESPWREHLMQRFSHGFIRIGLDGATEADYEILSRSI